MKENKRKLRKLKKWASTERGDVKAEICISRHLDSVRFGVPTSIFLKLALGIGTFRAHRPSCQHHTHTPTSRLCAAARQPLLARAWQLSAVVVDAPADVGAAVALHLLVTSVQLTLGHEHSNQRLTCKTQCAAALLVALAHTWCSHSRKRLLHVWCIQSFRHASFSSFRYASFRFILFVSPPSFRYASLRPFR